MREEKLHGELCLTFPDGFHVLDADEMNQIFPVDVPNRWAIWDTERRIIISVQWHEANALLALLASTKDLAKRVASEAMKAYKGNASQVGELHQTTLCGEEAWGVNYAYEVRGVSQVAHALVFKHARGSVNSTYTITCYARQEGAGESERVFKDVLDSLALVEPETL